MSEFTVRSKAWLEYKGRPFLGDGRYRLLCAVEQCGSINAAARELDISYRKVWSQLQAMEESAPFPLLKRRIGGKNGGATRLTEEALELIKGFRQLRKQVNDGADRCFSECFPGCS